MKDGTTQKCLRCHHARARAPSVRNCSKILLLFAGFPISGSRRAWTGVENQKSTCLERQMPGANDGNRLTRLFDNVRFVRKAQSDRLNVSCVLLESDAPNSAKLTPWRSWFRSASKRSACLRRCASEQKEAVAPNMADAEQPNSWQSFRPADSGGC